jgi:hypothetical protein
MKPTSVVDQAVAMMFLRREAMPYIRARPPYRWRAADYAMWFALGLLVIASLWTAWNVFGYAVWEWL